MAHTNGSSGKKSLGFRKKPWTVLFYLCADHASLEKHIRQDLEEIRAAGSSPHLNVAAQLDTPGGARRCLIGAAGAGSEEDILGTVNTGDPEAAVDFLRWGLDRCPSDRLAVVLSGTGILDERSAISSHDENRRRVFSICEDSSTGDALDASDLRTILERALQGSSRTKIDLVAFDMCETQFLEVAYQLEGLADVMVGAQSQVPDSGWDYTAVLQDWHEALRSTGGKATARELAKRTVPLVGRCYLQGKGRETAELTVSALDLERLDDIARPFDALTHACMQALSDYTTWEARKRVFTRFRERADATLDLRLLMEALAEELKNGALQADREWVGWYVPTRDDGRLIAILKVLEQALADADGSGRASGTAAERERAVADVRAVRVEAEKRRRSGSRRVPEHTKSIRRRLLDAHDKNAALWGQALAAAGGRLPPQAGEDLRVTQQEGARAEHLADLARRVALFVTPGSAPEHRFVLARHPEESPRCGVCLYRPDRLDDLMESNYLALDFNRRIHWAALLGAINLVENHPRSLWRIVSSLLGTAGQSARENLLQRLTGSDAVVGSFRDQFKAMAGPARMTLSLERRAGGQGRPKDSVYYLARLESSRRDAVVREQESRVNPVTIENALGGLERLLKRPWVSTGELAELESLGQIVGEDIIRNLTDALEEERAGQEEHELHLQLQLPRELMRYPWELMHDRLGWLSERYALGRQVFMDEGVVQWRTRRRPGGIRPLIIGDPKLSLKSGLAQLPGARAEAEQVATLFEHLRDQMHGAVDFDRRRDTLIGRPVNTNHLRSLLGQGGYDVVHFAGHAFFKTDDPESSAWVLSDGELWAQDIRNSLAWSRYPPWLVYANACEAGMESDRPRATYQGDVFGLATAFINQGVAAYIAPLWPIDDTVALQIATDFYQALALERHTLGEALRLAKREAKRMTVGLDADGRGALSLSPRMGLSWASLALYGDATATLMQRLGAPVHEAASRGVESPARAGADGAHAPRRRSVPVGPPVPLQVAPGIAQKLVAGPGMEPVPDARSGGDRLPDDRRLLELVEEGGVRYWRTREPGGDWKPLADGELQKLAFERAAAFRQRGLTDYAKVVGRWIVGRDEQGLLGDLAKQYDRETVPEEGLVTPQDEGGAAAPIELRDWAPSGNADWRILLLLHGTFSRTQAPAAALGQRFLHWARDRYELVIGYDHWTLSKGPEENAKELWDRLPAAVNEGRHIDIITHSRGGLVARALTELQAHAAQVRRVVFVGTPNCGTTLADPKSWGRAADLLANLLHLGGFEAYGLLSSFLARLVISQGTQLATEQLLAAVPGLGAQNPSALSDGQFLGRLAKAARPEGVAYSVVTANYEPRREGLHITRLFKEAGNKAADRFFDTANDLVVDTANVWGNKQPIVPGERVLLYDPGGSGLKPPEGVLIEALCEVHHTNIFAVEKTREFLVRELSRS